MSTVSRLQHSNPVPDESRLLSEAGELDRFVSEVRAASGLLDRPTKTSQPEKGDPSKPARPTYRRRYGTSPKRSRYRGVLVAVGAAALTFLFFGATILFWQGGAGSSGPASTTSDPIEAVISAYDDLNNGDVDRWLARFTDDADIFGVTKPLASQLYSVLAEANYRTTPHGPCNRAEAESGDEVLVACTITETNDFHGAGGLSLTREEVFVFNEQGLIREASARVVSFTQPGYFVFNQAFFDWLRSAHPEVHSEIRPEIATHLPQDPEHMRKAMEYLDRFLAQSDAYPVVTD